MLLSANLGFLFTDLPLADRILAAKAAGFDAVEFHDQLQTADLTPIHAALKATRLPVLSLNIHMGASAGSAALVGQEHRFRNEFRAAIEVADAVDATAIHVLSGRAVGAQALQVMRCNLDWASRQTARTILLEPICPQANAGYFMDSIETFGQVADGLDENIKMMADFYHLSNIYADNLIQNINHVSAKIAHAQVAHPLTRGDPWPDQMQGWQAFAAYLAEINVPALGLEYRPTAPVADLVKALRA